MCRHADDLYRDCVGTEMQTGNASRKDIDEVYRTRMVEERPPLQNEPLPPIDFLVDWISQAR